MPAAGGSPAAAYGDETDHEHVALSPTAHEIAAALMNGPLPSATLRVLVGDRNRYQRSVTELQRSLLVTNAGTAEQASGWPSSVLDLTCRRFDVGGGYDRSAAARVFLNVVLECAAGDLARAFRWPVAEARSCLDALVEAGHAVAGDRAHRSAFLA